MIISPLLSCPSCEVHRCLRGGLLSACSLAPGVDASENGYRVGYFVRYEQVLPTSLLSESRYPAMHERSRIRRGRVYTIHSVAF